MASNNIDDDDNAHAMISNIYRIGIEELKEASVICPSLDYTEYFNPVLHREIPDGTDSRGIK
jgi:hypothetical protein